MTWVNRPAEQRVSVQVFFVLLVVAATWFAYSNSLNVPFLLDDEASILKNQSIRDLSKISRVLCPPETVGVGGRPILNASFAANHALSGDSPLGYHVTNLVIHTLGGLTLFGLMQRLLRSPRLGPRFDGSAIPLALTIALLWLVHPVQTSSVTYISQRAESLMGLFYLLTIYCAVRAISGGHWSWALGALISCVAGIETKEVMVTAPLLVALCDRCLFVDSIRELWNRRKWLYIGLTAACLPLFLSINNLSHRDIGAGFGTSPITYALLEAHVIWHYVGLVFWPVRLVFDYGPQPFEVGVRAAWLVPTIGLVAFALYALCRWPAAGLALATFLLILVPTSSVVPITAQPMAENRLYLPLAAAIALGVVLVYLRLGRWAFAICGILALWCIGRTFERNRDFRTEISIWTGTAEKQSHNGRAYTNLGAAYFHAGQIAESIGYFQKAIQLNPADADAYNNLGSALLAVGQSVQAIAAYENAIRCRSNFANAEYNLGTALLRHGSTDAARSHLAEAVRLDSDSYEAALNLGTALLLTDNIDAAIEQLRHAAELGPNLGEAHLNLGEAFLRHGDNTAALSEFQKATLLSPMSAVAHNSYGNALVRLGRIAEAIREYESASQLDPNYLKPRESLRKLSSIDAPQGTP